MQGYNKSFNTIFSKSSARIGGTNIGTIIIKLRTNLDRFNELNHDLKLNLN
jgi:DNA-binding HxlR family transcriptional regulator